MDTVEGIFRKHGAVKLSTPLLMPQSSVYDRCEPYVCVMARHGGLVTLPYDLRVRGSCLLCSPCHDPYNDTGFQLSRSMFDPS